MTGLSLSQRMRLFNPPAEARRILLEFHYTPKHAGWLNIAEIEIGEMNKQCLDRRIEGIGVADN